MSTLTTTWEADPFPPAPLVAGSSPAGNPPTPGGPGGPSGSCFATPRGLHHVRIQDLSGGSLSSPHGRHPLREQAGWAPGSPPGGPPPGTPKSCFPSTSKEQQSLQGLPLSDHPLPEPAGLRHPSVKPPSARRRGITLPLPPPLPPSASHHRPTARAAAAAAAAGPSPVPSHGGSSGNPGRQSPESTPPPRVKVKPYHTANRQLYNLSLLRTSTQEFERDK